MPMDFSESSMPSHAEENIIQYIEEDMYPTLGSSTTNEWMPTCDDAIKPTVGMTFESIEHGKEFYKKYALAVGFSVRVSSEKKNIHGVKTWKYFVCSKEGHYKKKNKVGMTSPVTKDKEKNVVTFSYKSRLRKYTREGCAAKLVLKLNEEGKYAIFKFYEGHSHALATPKKRQFLRSSRNLSQVHKELFCAYSRANVGPSQAFHLLKEQVNGYENIGFTVRDLRNYHRDLKAMVNDSDAHIFIDNLERKKSIDPLFYYAYKLDDQERLEHVFWVDGICRRNYALFGDAISFDTTYRTNKYSMIFAPFTGINHHHMLINLGAALLGDEKIDSFIWLFEHFLEAMGGHEPNIIITDQDPAMKAAIERVFKVTVHRFCMWHILKKVSEKICVNLNKSSEFDSRFKSCVWMSETAEEFESAWMSIIDDFRLQRHDWLKCIYDIRKMWVPAYFKNSFMGAIMRTTSISESENSFFGRLLNKGLSLVEFWVRFDSSMEAQRYKELTEENNMLTCIPDLKTPLRMEKHAREIYTHKMFYIFQEELWSACIVCGIERVLTLDEKTIFVVIDNNNNHARPREVVYNGSEQLAHCSCKKFETEGMPCRHILFVLKVKGIDEIPSFYIVNRWTKMAISKPIFHVVENAENEFCNEKHTSKLISDAWSQLFKCMHIAGRCNEKIHLIIESTQALEKELLKDKSDNAQGISKELQSYAGCIIPDQVSIHPPKYSSTKGSGKRLKGGKEKAMEQHKNLRLCRACGKQAQHDSRNCPTKTTSEKVNYE